MPDTGVPNSRFEKLIKYFNIKIIYIRVSSETCMPEVLGVVLHFWPLRIWAVILYFPIPHNALCLPPRFCINYCCEILLRICTSPKSISQQLFMQMLGANRVHHGELENREWARFRLPPLSWTRVSAG